MVLAVEARQGGSASLKEPGSLATPGLVTWWRDRFYHLKVAWMHIDAGKGPELSEVLPQLLLEYLAVVEQ